MSGFSGFAVLAMGPAEAHFEPPHLRSLASLSATDILGGRDSPSVNRASFRFFELADDIWKADNNVVIVLQGWLENRDEVLAELRIPASVSCSEPDGWVAARAWERWGEQCLAHLEGEFSFVAADRNLGRLFAARDIYGSYPLYYLQLPEGVVVGTDARLLSQIAGRSPAVNMGLIVDNLVGAGRDSATTMTSVMGGCQVLPAATVLIADRSSVKTRRYWSFDPSSPQIRHARDDDYVAEGRFLLDRAVKAAMRTSGKVGSDLTGGLDSSSIAVTALDFLGGQDKLPTFTHVVDPGWGGRVESGRYGEEEPFVREIAAMHPRIMPHFHSSTGYSWDYGLDDFMRASGSYTTMPFWLSSHEQRFREARSQGVSVVLNGGSGNISLSWSGSGAFVEWFRQRQFRRLYRELRATAPGAIPFSRAIISRLAVPLGPKWLQARYRRYKYGDFAGDMASRYSFANPELARERRAHQQIVESDYYGWLPEDMQRWRAESLMPGDKAGGGEFANVMRSVHGVEYRDPLISRKLVEWCLRVPEEQYWQNGQPRSLIRRIMKGRLPDSILNGRTRGMPMADWHFQMTRQLPAIREQIEVLSADPDVAALIDFKRINKMLDEWPEKPPVSKDESTRILLSIALPHALTVGRFIRWTKGANL